MSDSSDNKRAISYDQITHLNNISYQLAMQVEFIIMVPAICWLFFLYLVVHNLIIISPYNMYGSFKEVLGYFAISIQMKST